MTLLAGHPNSQVVSEWVYEISLRDLDLGGIDPPVLIHVEAGAE